MGLWLLANTVARDAAEIRVTNSSNAKVSSAEHAGIDNLRGGPRSLKYTTGSTSTRNIVYLNKAGTLRASHVVIAGASALQGLDIEVLGWTTYASGASVLLDDPSFDVPTYGIDGSDWVFDFVGVETNQEGFELSINSPGKTIDLLKVYFCEGFEFDHAGPVQFQRVPVHAPAVLHCGNYYKLHATANFRAGPVTRAQLETYRGLPKEDPVFFYDDTGGDNDGDHLPHKSWHCVITSDEAVVEYVDGSEELLFISFELGLLKHGNG